MVHRQKSMKTRGYQDPYPLSLSLPAQAAVSSLIAESGEWDDSTIDNHFLPYDAQLIKSIPFSSTSHPDSYY